MSAVTGGCQCGAVRFRAERLGRASICHCRMCQKATGSFFGPFVDAHGLTWTRGEPKRFQSSNIARRGFCADCGTPLTYEAEQGTPNIAIGALDDPGAAAPVVQIGLQAKLSYVDGLSALPVDESAKAAEAPAHIISYQHPDHDTPGH